MILERVAKKDKPSLGLDKILVASTYNHGLVVCASNQVYSCPSRCGLLHATNDNRVTFYRPDKSVVQLSLEGAPQVFERDISPLLNPLPNQFCRMSSVRIKEKIYPTVTCPGGVAILGDECDILDFKSFESPVACAEGFQGKLVASLENGSIVSYDPDTGKTAALTQKLEGEVARRIHVTKNGFFAASKDRLHHFNENAKLDRIVKFPEAKNAIETNGEAYLLNTNFLVRISDGRASFVLQMYALAGRTLKHLSLLDDRTVLLGLENGNFFSSDLTELSRIDYCDPEPCYGRAKDLEEIAGFKPVLSLSGSLGGVKYTTSNMVHDVVLLPR